MKIRNRSIRFGLLLSAASLTAFASFAAAPPAGSKIGNQASATYVNASGDTISVTSNKVETIVQQVAGLTLTTDNTETVAPGGKAFLPHSITNDGNGTDTFDLTATEEIGGPFDFTNITIFPDANFDGVADSTTPISVTPTLAAGESFGFVIEATVPSGAVIGASETVDVVAVSQFSGTTPTVVTANNTDTVIVSDGPVSEIVKAMTVTDTSGDNLTGPGDTVTITLTYSSTGLAAADNLVVTDQLDQYLTYVDGSGVWSDSTTSLTDTDADGFELANGNNFEIDYSYDGTDTVEFQIDSVPRGRTATVTFQATINADAPAGDIANIATQTVDGTPFPPSNESIVSVDPTYSVSAADAAASTFAADPDGAANLDAGNTSATDDDGTLNDIVEETTDTFQGGQVVMEFVITNHANVTDTIDLSVANDATNGFPAGTTFQLVGADGATPIVGPLGPLATGASETVNIIAKLPSSAPATAAGETNYEVGLTAQSTNGGLPNSVTGLFTGAVLGATVDMTNTDAKGPDAGVGPGPNDGSTLINNATDPGVPTTFPLTVTNGGPTADTYDLSLPNPLPPGWTVEFQLPDGTPITNTGVVPGGGSQDIIVVVTPPADEVPGVTPVQVEVVSPTSGQGDTLTNAVEVNEIVDVALTTDQTVQVAPGGIADIPHVLTNEGNIAITEGALTPAETGGFDTFSGTVFWDVDGNREVDATDIVVDNIDDIGSIAPGDTIPLIHRVQVPSNGAIGVSETETLTLATSLNGGTKTDADTSDNSVTDTVIIVSGDLTLVKMQAVDPGCNGSIVGSFVTTDVEAEPGQCIRYQITANNTGTADADVVTIKDTIPGFTTLTECAGACEVAVTPTGSSVTQQPLEGAGGPMESVHGTLIPGAPATLEFTVKIDE